MRNWIVFGLLAVVVACTERSGRSEERAASVAEVDAAAAAFLDFAHNFDYTALRANATPDFEILIFGQRLSVDGFVNLLRRMEESRDGRPLNGYELEALNTRVVGDVAYTSWESDNWLESAVLIRNEGKWLVDRAASVRVGTGP